MDLKRYREEIQKIRDFAHSKNVSDLEVTRIFQETFERLEKREGKCLNLRSLLKICTITLCLGIFCLASFDRRFFTATIMRNLQNSIYPGLKLLRKFAVPIVYRYPQLSELYDEWCLLENPYFYVNEMECWPCTVVKSVPDLTGRNITRSFNVGIPYTRSERDTRVQAQQFYELLARNLEAFAQDAFRISSNNSTLTTISDVVNGRFDVNPSSSAENHITWRMNRMKPGRLIRKLFPKPKELPDWWEQSIERFVFVDESMAPAYSLPNPECSNVVLRCAAGSRLIKMTPSPECVQSCEPSTILLSSGNTLWYNWWYWRPISLPVKNSTEISINYLTSFC